MAEATTITTRPRRERPPVVRLTEAAAVRLRDIIANAETPIAGVRVGVRNGGCAGQAYTMDYAAEKTALDEVIVDKGVTLLIDPKAILFLIGTELDWKADKLAARFVFRNPNETDACGCGESIAITPAKDEDF